MKVSSLNNNYRFNNKAKNVAFTGNAANYFAKHTNVGEGTSIALDFVGKAIVAPLFIMFNPISKEPQDKKQYAALKNPVAGLIQLAMEAPIFLIGSQYIARRANEGRFDDKYNVAKAEKAAIDLAKKDGKTLSEDALKEATKATRSRLGILQSRSCFIASLVLTPIMCSLENYIHPKLMKHLDLRKEQKEQKAAESVNANTAEVKK